MLYYKEQLNTLHDTFHPMPTYHLQWVFQKENCLQNSSTLSCFCIQLKRGKYVTISLFITAEKAMFFCNFIFSLWMPWSKNVRLWTTWHLQVFFVRHLSHCLKSHFVVSVFEQHPLNLFLQDLWNLTDLFGSIYFLHRNLHVEISPGILIAPSFKTDWTYVSPNWNQIKGLHDCHFWISFSLTFFYLHVILSL